MAISPFPPGVLSEQPPPDPANLWQAPSLIYDYRQAANPIRKGLTEPIPYRQWRPPTLDLPRSTVLPLDLSDALGCPGPATSPALAAHFLSLTPGDPLRPRASASSSLFVVLRGAGRLEWAPGAEATTGGSQPGLPPWPGARGMSFCSPMAPIPNWWRGNPACCFGCMTGRCSTIWASFPPELGFPLVTTRPSA